MAERETAHLGESTARSHVAPAEDAPTGAGEPTPVHGALEREPSGEADAPTEPEVATRFAPEADAGSGETAGDSEPGDAPAAQDDADEKPTLESAPLDPRTESPDARDWIALLRTLDGCSEEAAYAELLERLLVDSAEVGSSEQLDELYRAALVLWSHEVDETRASEQRRAAGETLRKLLTNGCLDSVIRRASGPDPGAGLHASRLLLHLGRHAVPRLLALLESESEPNRRSQLAGILIAIGAGAEPELVARVRSDDPRRARGAARLLGEIRSAKAVEPLSRLLHAEPVTLRNEAVRALVRIGSDEARDVLLAALVSPRSDVRSLAAFGLGVTRDPEVLPALEEALRRALRKQELDLGQEVIKGIGRVGHADAVPVLAGVLGRRSLLHGRTLRQLKLAATAALGRIPGDEARAALQVAARSGDSRVRKLARLALDRRDA